LVLSGISVWKMPPKNVQAASQASMALAVVSGVDGHVKPRDSDPRIAA
jgi:hypothetical protein